jgi:hypothetical protein
MFAATCIREKRDFAILWAVLGLRACGQSAGERKRVCHSLLCCHDFHSRRGSNFFAVFSCERRKERDILAACCHLLVQRFGVCQQLFRCLFLQEKKRERRYPRWLYPFLQEKESESCYPCWLYPPCAKGEDLSSSSCFVSSCPFCVLRLSCLASLT